MLRAQEKSQAAVCEANSLGGILQNVDWGKFGLGMFEVISAALVIAIGIGAIAVSGGVAIPALLGMLSTGSLSALGGLTGVSIGTFLAGALATVMGTADAVKGLGDAYYGLTGSDEEAGHVIIDNIEFLKNDPNLYYMLESAVTLGASEGTRIMKENGVDPLKLNKGDYKTTTAADWEGKTDELAKSSPVEIPDDAIVKVQHKAGGYDQISYKWSDGTYKYEARWHTPTPNAPEGSPNSWVVERTKPGTPTGQQKVQSIYTPGINDDWTPKWEWEEAVDAYNKGTTTPRQDAILNSGHVNAP